MMVGIETESCQLTRWVISQPFRQIVGEISSVQGEEFKSIPSLDQLLERYRDAMGQEKNSLEVFDQSM